MPAGDTVLIQFTAKENISAVTGGIVSAFDRLTKQLQTVNSALGTAGTKASSQPWDKMATGVKTSTDSFGQMQQQVKGTTSTMALTGSAADSVNAQFNKLGQRIVVTRDAAGNLSAEVKKSTITLDEHGNAIQKTNKSWLNYMTGVFGGIGLYTLASSALRTFKTALSSVGEAAFGLNAMLETNRMAFTNFLGSAQAADAMLSKLFQFAAVTPFQFPEVVDASKKIMAFGFSAEEVIPVLTAVGNATSGLGSGALGIERITLALGQMAAKGKVQGQELPQLGEAGIRVQEILKMVADKMSISLAEVIKLQETGGLKAKVFIDAFMEYTQIKFGDMMMQQSKTFVGAMSTIQDITQMTIAQAFEPLFKIMSAKAYNVATFMQTAEFQKQAENVKTILTGLINTFMSIGTAISHIIVPVLVSVGILLATQLPAAIGFVVTALQGLFLAIASNPIGLLAIGLALAAKTFIDFKNASDQAAVAQAKHLTIALEYAKQLGDEGARYLELTRQVESYYATSSRLPGILKSIAEWGGQAFKPQAIKDAEAALASYNQKVTATGVAESDLNEIRRLRQSYDTAQQFNPAAATQAAAATKLLEQNQILLASATSNYKDTFDKLVSSWITGGDVSYATGQTMYDALNITPADNFKTVLDTIVGKMKDLDSNTQLFIGQQLGAIFRDMSANVINDTQALSLMVGVLNQVDATAAKAADVKRWQDYGAAVTAGMAGIIIAGPDIQAKVVGELVPQSDIDKQIADAQKVGAEWEIQAEKIRRAMGTSTEKNLNWTQPLKEGSAVLVEMQGDLANLTAKQAEANAKVAEWGQWNAAAGSRAVEGYNAAMAALGAYMAKQVMAAQLSGKISEQEAQALYKAYETAFGAGLSNEDKLSLALTKSSKDFEKLGLIGQMAWAAIAAEAQKTLLQSGKTDAGTDKAIKSITSNSKDWMGQIKLLQDAYGDLGPEGQLAVAGIVQKALEAKDPYTELVRLVGEATKGFVSLKKETTGDWMGVSPAFTKGVDDKDYKKNQADWAKQARDQFVEDGKAAASAYLEKLNATLTDESAQSNLNKSGATTGNSIVDGLIGALNAANDAAGNAMWGLCNALVNAAIKRLQSGSPSKVFAGIGTSVGEGMTQGINASMPSSQLSVIGWIQDLIKQFSGLSVDPRVKDMADAVGSVVDAFSSAVDVLIKLQDDFRGVNKSKIDQAISDMQQITDALLNYAWKFVGAFDADKMQGVGDAMGSLVSMFGDGVDALIKMQDYSSVERTVIDKVLSDIRYLISHMIDMASAYVGIPDMSIVADSMSGLLGVFSDGVDALTSTADYTAIARDKIDLIVNDILYLVSRMVDGIRALGEIPDIKQISSVADMANNLLSTFGTGADSLTKARDYVKVARSSLDAVIDDLIYVAQALSTRLPTSLTKGAGEALAGLADGLSNILAPLTGISSYVGMARDKLTGIAPALEAFERDLRGLFGRLAGLADWLASQGDLKDKMIALGTTLKEIMEPVGKALEVLVGIGKYIPLAREWRWSGRAGERPIAIAPALEAFENDLRGLFGRLGGLADWLSSQTGLATKMLALGPVLAAVFSPLKDAIEVLNTIRDYVPLARNEAGIAPAFDSFMADLRGLFGRLAELATWLADQTNVSGPLAPQMKQLGEVLSAVFNGLKSVMDVIGNIQDVATRVGDIGGFSQAMTIIQTAISEVLRFMKMWAGAGTGSIDIGVLDETNPLVKYAKMLSDIIAPISSIIGVATGLYDLAEKAATSQYRLDYALTQLHDITVSLVLNMKQWYAGDIDIGTGDARKALVDYAIALESIVRPFTTIIQVASTLYDYADKVTKSQYALWYVMDKLNEITVTLVLTMETWAGTLNVGDLDASKNTYIKFADVLNKILAPFSTIISIASSMIELAKTLAENEFSLADALGVLDSVTRDLLGKMTAWANDAGIAAQITQILEAQQTKFIDNLTRVLTPLQTIISITSSMVDLATRFQDGMIDWTTVLSVLDIAIRKLLGKLRDWANDDELLGEIAAIIAAQETNFAVNLQKALAPISTVISTISSLIDLSKKFAEGVPDWASTITFLVSGLKELLTQWKKLADNAEFGNLIGDWSTEFNTNLKNALEPLSLVVSTLNSLMDFADRIAKEMPVWSDIITFLVSALKAVMTEWNKLGTDAGFAALIAGFLTDFSKNLQNALSPISTATSALNALMDFSDRLAKGTYVWATIITDLKLALLAVMEQWQLLAHGDFADAIANFPEDFSKNMTNVFGPIQTATSALTALIDWTAKLGKKTYDWSTIVAGVATNLGLVLVEWKKLSVGTFADDIANFPKDFSTNMQNVFGPIKTAVDALEAVSKYTGMLKGASGRIPPQIQAFANDVAAFVQAFADATKDISVGQPLVDFGNALNAIIQPVKTYIDTFYWLWRYESVWARTGGRGQAQPTNFMPEQFKALAGDIKLLVTEMATLANDPLMQSAVASAQQLSTDLAPLMTFIQDSMDFMAKLLNYSRAGNYGNLTNFLDDFSDVLVRLASWFTTMSPLLDQVAEAISAVGFQFGVSLIDSMILGIQSRQQALADAISSAVGNAMPVVGVPVGVMPATAKTSSTVTIQEGPVYIQFTGQINASNPADIEKLASRVEQIMTARAGRMKKSLVLTG